MDIRLLVVESQNKYWKKQNKFCPQICINITYQRLICYFLQLFFISKSKINSFYYDKLKEFKSYN